MCDVIRRRSIYTIAFQLGIVILAGDLIYLVQTENSRQTPSLDDFLIVDDFQKYAEQHMDKTSLSYVQTGAMLEQTLKENTEAFLRLRLQHKLLRNTVNLNISTTLLGTYVPFPIGICPNALQLVEHPDGENATARAAAAEGTVMILSSESSLSMEEVAESAPDGVRWFQVDAYFKLSLMEDLLKRAKNAGYKAIVLTADLPVLSFRITSKRSRFSFKNQRLGNFEKYHRSSNFKKSSEERHFVVWNDLPWIKNVSGLPLVVKGVLTAEDAELAVQNGADAIIVSTHGGRQLDCVPASIEALPEVVKAVNGRVEVYLDSGVRTGSDVVKAMALGARAVFIGRPNLYGLFAAGEQGSRKVMQLITNELKNTMHLIGAANNCELNPSYVRREEYYRRPL